MPAFSPSSVEPVMSVFAHAPSEAADTEPKGPAERMVPDRAVEQSAAPHELIERALQRFDPEWRSLRFERDGSHLVIEVLDEKGEVIRSIPPETLRRLAEQMGVETGVLIDTVS